MRYNCPHGFVIIRASILGVAVIRSFHICSYIRRPLGFQRFCVALLVGSACTGPVVGLAEDLSVVAGPGEICLPDVLGWGPSSIGGQQHPPKKFLVE